VFVLRCTKRLLDRIGGPTAPEPEPSSTTRLGDYYANFIIIRRQQLVLAVSGITLLPVLLPAAPFKTVPSRLVDAVAEMLHALGTERQKIASEVSAMRDECLVAKTNSRQVLGSMLDFTNMLEAYLDERPLVEVALHLAESPCSPLGMDSPGRATIALLGQDGSRSKQPALRLVRT
jgi:hypothetical protein